MDSRQATGDVIRHSAANDGVIMKSRPQSTHSSEVDFDLLPPPPDELLNSSSDSLPRPPSFIYEEPAYATPHVNTHVDSVPPPPPQPQQEESHYMTAYAAARAALHDDVTEEDNYASIYAQPHSPASMTLPPPLPPLNGQPSVSSRCAELSLTLGKSLLRQSASAAAKPPPPPLHSDDDVTPTAELEAGGATWLKGRHIVK